MNDHSPDNSGVPQAQPPAYSDLRPMYDPHAFSPSALSIAAFVLGILSFMGCGPCFGLPALVIGLVELRNIRDRVSPGESRAFALTGAILGGISLGLGVLIAAVYLAVVVIAVLSGTGEGFY